MRYQDATIASPPDVAECLDHEMQKDFANMFGDVQKKPTHDNTCLVMCKKTPGRIVVYTPTRDLIVLGNMTSIAAEMLPSMAEYAAHIKSPFHEFLTICIKHDLSLVKYLIAGGK